MTTLNTALLNQLPGIIGFKNVNSIYMGGNDKLATLMGYKAAEDIQGCRDTDVRSEIAELANDFIKQDKNVMQHGEQQHIDIGHHASGDLRIHLSTKKPLYNDKHKLIGTVFNCIALQPSILKTLQAIIKKTNAPVFYQLTTHDSEYDLSNRELECLFYLLRGHTAKMIANKLQLSPKTVEYYTEQLKNKLDCTTKPELIEKAIEMGFMFNFPINIFKKTIAS
tara:strand:- start:144359 stop:145027 length:669 start_codon:yes stop_codon:yes gene_type:complete